MFLLHAAKHLIFPSAKTIGTIMKALRLQRKLWKQVSNNFNALLLLVIAKDVHSQLQIKEHGRNFSNHFISEMQMWI